MFLSAADNKDPFYTGGSLFTPENLQNATNYGAGLADNYGKYVGQTGRGMLLPKTAKQKALARKSVTTLNAKQKSSDGEAISTAAIPAQSALPKFDVKEWLSGSVYVAGRNVPRKILVGIAVSGVLLLVLGSLGKKTVIEAVR